MHVAPHGACSPCSPWSGRKVQVLTLLSQTLLSGYVIKNMVSDLRLDQFTAGNKGLFSLHAVHSNHKSRSIQLAVFRASGAAAAVLSGCALMQAIKALDNDSIKSELY